MLLDLSKQGTPAESMANRAEAAAAFLKALSHEGRLMILCHLSGGERSVTELEALLACRQAAVSQQLARLRAEGLVSCRREGKTIYYALADPRVVRIIAALHETFCPGAEEAAGGGPPRGEGRPVMGQRRASPQGLSG